MVPEIQDYFDQSSRQLDYYKQASRSTEARDTRLKWPVTYSTAVSWYQPETARARAIAYSMNMPTMMQPKPTTTSVVPKGKRPFEDEYGFLCAEM